MTQSWKRPAPGDIVWCLFPELPDVEPGPKSRPALVLSVESREDGDLVRVAYGTSQNVTRLKAGEVAILQAKHPAAYALAGLAYDTKFDFKVIVELAWSDRYFKVPLRNRHGNIPKIGTLHATVHHAVEAAYRAAMSR
ncbi:MAG: type II toxin-antitoxin system PemK/MazF family toxin [Rhodoferax sp.]|uniref:type II toxin-antitoxin system PemK/MazF family toxin n=1 Tax=Rhodoferax sp. TaxID=50421 RepID=UPI0026254840|nr:type II toxin-antitoxin system PemK/MazF family toxin [Rhodoferax sp.]MDD5334163.1 type II toxin-antitoxin system PemK/MazF family toxin [Rhodoferax sp.]